jgi:hypothetical protein
MDWKQLLGSITTSVDEELRLRKVYLVVENRLLRQQIPGRVQFTDSDRKALAELGRQALAEMATRGPRERSVIAAALWRLCPTPSPLSVCPF